MKHLLYTDSNKFRLQVGYNEDFAKKANEIIEALTKICGNLSDEQIRTFLSDPTKLADEVVNTSKSEFDAYLANVPESVRLSVTFSDGGKGDAIKKLHKALMDAKPYNMVNKVEIVNGTCVLTEEGKEALRNECSIFGGDKSKEIADKVRDCVRALNELDLALRLNSAGLECIENWGRWSGVIGFQYDNSGNKYYVNYHLIPLINK